jgi:rhamnose utilization protein RhaD (predicted bifunctional aldolase and dehydrogenase)/NAD(P)-dependent dehydrogenase (short-subunit alcohol dehydrogenase family)
MTAGSHPLDEITQVSRRLGADPSLVLHGGGNTSIKGTLRDVTGEHIDVVWVKGSGWDLGSIEPAGFAPLRRERLLQVLEAETLSDAQMVNEVRQASLDASAPTASIEALLHAFIPHRVVLHSHADAIVALTNQPSSAGTVMQVLGSRVLVLPYVMPGFDLARMVASAGAAVTAGDVDALVLSNHGLFTFADDAESAYQRHLELVDRASTALGVTTWGEAGVPLETRGGDIREIAALRSDISAAADRPMILRQSESSRAADFAARPDAVAAVRRGTATPEHIIRTKRVPLVGRDVPGFVSDYQRYVDENRARFETLTVLDPAPRVVLDPAWGLLTAGTSAEEASAIADIAVHTMDIIDAADRASAYLSLDEEHSFDIEYWELEQARIRKKGGTPMFTGEVAVVTGAASGIGRACASALLAAGAAVIGIDLNPAVESAFDSPAWCPVVGDVSDQGVLDTATELAVRSFGGIDILVVAAGIFPESAPLSELDDSLWDRSIRVNATAVARIFRQMHPFLALAPNGGRVVLVSTKNVAAPGPGAAAYSASKIAAAQLARVAALEWAADGIRVNQVEPDAVFDTGIWTPELLAERAARYGMSIDEYRTRNLLGVEVTSAKVAEAVTALCSSAFSASTGVHLSVDGGNDRVI